MIDEISTEFGKLVKEITIFKLQPLFCENKAMTRGLFYIAISDLLNKEPSAQIYKYEKNFEDIILFLSSNFFMEPQMDFSSYKQSLNLHYEEFIKGNIDKHKLDFYRKNYNWDNMSSYDKKETVQYLCELVIKNFLAYAVHVHCINCLTYSSVYHSLLERDLEFCREHTRELKNKIQKIIFYYSSQISSNKSVARWMGKTYDAIVYDEIDARIVEGSKIINQNIDEMFSIF